MQKNCPCTHRIEAHDPYGCILCWCGVENDDGSYSLREDEKQRGREGLANERVRIIAKVEEHPLRAGAMEHIGGLIQRQDMDERRAGRWAEDAGWGESQSRREFRRDIGAKKTQTLRRRVLGGGR